MIFGIDLGTSNSLIARLSDGHPIAIPNAIGQVLTPSVVSVDEDGTILVGQAAKERLVTKPAASAASFKRLMGTATATRLGNRDFQAEELSALVLRALKADAEAATGQVVSDVVISVPAYFNDQQRKATRLAGELAGLNVRRLVNEPTAAALFHGIHERGSDSKFLVFDLGGGTFDVSILDRFAGIMEVRATGGDSFLGGDDFTAAMARLICTKAGVAPEKLEAMAATGPVRFAAEAAKRRLVPEVQTAVALPAGVGAGGEVTVTQEEYEAACAPLLARLRAPVERALRDARLRAAELDEIVLVGGATRMPAVRKLVAQLFARLPARHVDPDQTVALGAAVCAGLTARDAAFEEVVLTDVCPHSLGVEVAERDGNGGIVGDIFLPVIERNTVVPASRVRTVSTLQDNQKIVQVDIYQGESRQCSKNIPLGRVEVPVPKKPAGGVSVNVRYTYDVNGILDVDVDVEGTGVSRNLVVKKLAGNVSDEDIERRRKELASLKTHPRDQEENRALLERGNRMYEQLLGRERELVGQWLAQFQASLNNQDPGEVRRSAVAFSEALDTLERSDVW
ncbi:MAG: molecular chaperone HscC [Burkholderiaceae bacterium]